MKRLALWGTIGLLAGTALAAPTKSKPAEKPLAPGAYTATVKSFVCGGCAEWVQSKLAADDRLEKVSADQSTRALSFTVKPQAVVKASDLQKVLDAAAADMGMGADYTMEKLTKTGR